jgi:CRP-like cAMP-binding protein
MANHARAITMTAPVRAALERLVRAATTPAGLSRRARAVLLMDEGLSGREIATRTGYTPVQISRIRARFAAAGVEGLADRARAGRAPPLRDPQPGRRSAQPR